MKAIAKMIASLPARPRMLSGLEKKWIWTRKPSQMVITSPRLGGCLIDLQTNPSSDLNPTPSLIRQHSDGTLLQLFLPRPLLILTMVLHDLLLPSDRRHGPTVRVQALCPQLFVKRTMQLYAHP